jgi:hypothetical protein
MATLPEMRPEKATAAQPLLVLVRSLARAHRSMRLMAR